MKAGRKRKEESRAEELRARLAEWKQMPESSRPSLRELASGLGVSHQILSYHLKNHPITLRERVWESQFEWLAGHTRADNLATAKVLRLLRPEPSGVLAPRSLSVKEASEALAVKPAAVRAWLRRGKLPHTGGGRFTRIPANVILQIAELREKRVRHRPWRPWRSPQESWQIRHLVWQWFTYRGPKWSERMLARLLGVHHHYVQKLVREFTTDPAKILREERERAFDVVTFEQLRKAQETTRQMRGSGLLRPLHRCKWVKIPDPLGRWPKRGWGWKAVAPKGTARVFRIPQDVPIWATPGYSMMCANRWRGD